VTGIDPDHEMRLTVLGALSRVLADVPALLALLAEADDESDAVRRLEQAYDFTPVQAQAVLDAQFRRVTRAHRAAVDAELRDVTDALAAPWDPPLDAQATVHSPQLVDLVIAGVEHRVEGENLDDCLGQVVCLVRESLARPERRRVAVTTGLADGPTRILVDPVGSAAFLYDGDTGER
jgi:hypothetical protein